MLLLVFITDRVVGFFFEKAYRNSKYGIFHRQEYCLHESKEEILILGSSRAAHHYVPQIIKDSIGLGCFNCGSDGMCIYYHYGVLSSYIERGDIPKVVLLEVMNTDAVVSNGATFGLNAAIDRFAPNYGEYAEIDSLLLIKGWKEKLKLFSKCYRYNSKAVQLFKCNFIPTTEDMGYEAVYGQLPDTTTLQKRKGKHGKPEEDKIVYFKKFINKCQENDIQLFIIESPCYEISSSYGINILKKIAEEFGVCWLDYKNITTLMHPKYFKDVGHLNDEGAHLFSIIIAGEIKKKLSIL